jgi:hypothetical protein
LQLLKKFFGRRAKSVEPKAVIPGAKDGGHGDHWGCLLQSVQEKELIPFLTDITRKDNHPYTFDFGPGSTDKGLAFYSNGTPLRACVLVANQMLASAYPEVQDGPVWPITITEIIPWSNGLEGQITGTCHGAAVAFFDTRFYANWRRYDVGQTYDFHMGALGYTVGRAPQREVETELGAKVSLDGAHAYMPANLDNEAADVDDLWFHSPLEGEKDSAYLIGPPIYSYPIVMAIPEDFEMKLDVYCGPHVLAPDMKNIQPNDDIQGYLWLLGYLA